MGIVRAVRISANAGRNALPADIRTALRRVCLGRRLIGVVEAAIVAGRERCDPQADSAAGSV